ncbi:MAG: hypothetical protein ACMVO3_19510 [Thalassobaculum sp.]
MSKRAPPRWRTAQDLAREMLGHNGGPPLDTASNWSTFCWRKAAKKARRTPPLEVLAMRRRRAAELGLDDRTFAAVLADCGRTPAALIFALGRDWIDYGSFGPRIGADGTLTAPPTVARKIAALSVPSVGSRCPDRIGRAGRGGDPIRDPGNGRRRGLASRSAGCRSARRYRRERRLARRPACAAWSVAGSGPADRRRGGPSGDRHPGPARRTSGGHALLRLSGVFG